jgi:hypothetical protein
MKEVRDATARVLDGTSLASLLSKIEVGKSPAEIS